MIVALGRGYLGQIQSKIVSTKAKDLPDAVQWLVCSGLPAALRRLGSILRTSCIPTAMKRAWKLQSKLKAKPFMLASYICSSGLWGNSSLLDLDLRAFTLNCFLPCCSFPLQDSPYECNWSWRYRRQRSSRRWPWGTPCYRYLDELKTWAWCRAGEARVAWRG